MTIAIDDGAGEGPTAPLNEATVAVASIFLDSDGAPLAQHPNGVELDKEKMLRKVSR